jgi:hypothetical protein
MARVNLFPFQCFVFEFFLLVTRLSYVPGTVVPSYQPIGFIQGSKRQSSLSQVIQGFTRVFV